MDSCLMHSSLRSSCIMLHESTENCALTHTEILILFDGVLN